MNFLNFFVLLLLLQLRFQTPSTVAFNPVSSIPLRAMPKTTALCATPTATVSRRRWLLGSLLSNVAAALIILPNQSGKNAAAAETIGKADDCNDSSCVGVWDGLLADCPHDGLRKLKGGAGCVCSQDDTPGVFSEP